MDRITSQDVSILGTETLRETDDYLKVFQMYMEIYSKAYPHEEAERYARIATNKKMRGA